MCICRLQVSFVAQPETVDFEVEVMGGQTLSGLIPSLKAWLIGFARQGLISMYVMPEHWVYRLDPVSPLLHLLPQMGLHGNLRSTRPCMPLSRAS